MPCRQSAGLGRAFREYDLGKGRWRRKATWSSPSRLQGVKNTCELHGQASPAPSTWGLSSPQPSHAELGSHLVRRATPKPPLPPCSLPYSLLCLTALHVVSGLLQLWQAPDFSGICPQPRFAHPQHSGLEARLQLLFVFMSFP